MTSSHSSFQGPNFHSISFDLPTPSTWIVLERVNEHEHRHKPDPSAVSYISFKYRCEKDGDPSQTSFLRIYRQVPHLGTEFEASATRASQARAWTPPELVAYKTLTEKQSTVTPRLLGYKEEKQERSAIVPGGFLVSFAWEQVSGVPLRNRLGENVFWDMSKDKRDIIREAFKRTYGEIEAMGIEPLFAGPSHLVWDSSSGNLFMVGFRQLDDEVEPTPWSEAKYYWFGLAKPPRKVDWFTWNKNPDTSNWKY